jgi:hypothetical protein
MIPVVGDKYSYNFGFDRTVKLVVEAIAIDNATQKQVFLLHKIGCNAAFVRDYF